ncbi:transposable element Tcb1 transposase [Trichonephila clavipes]|nr:transposable element Tcb1 transposase [Trichonephila clavipes]
MVWGAFAYNTRSPLVLIRGTMTAQRYVLDILQTTCVSTHATAPKSHFSTRQCSASHGNGVTRLPSHCYTLPGPALSPYLSPIEHIRDYLGWRVGIPTSLCELETRLQQICNEISQDIIQNPIVSHRAFVLEGVQQGIKSSIVLPFSLK